MKKVFFFFIICCFSAVVQAQDIEVKFGPMTPETRSTMIRNAHVVGDKVFTVQSIDPRDKRMSVVLYDAQTLTKNDSRFFKQFNCGDEKDCLESEYEYNRTSFFKENVVMFFETFDRKNDDHILWAQRTDFEGNFVGEMKKIDKIEAKRKSNAGTFLIEMNNDSTQFVVITNPPFKRYNDEKFNFSVYGSDLKLLHSASLALPMKDKNVSLQDYYLDNNGKVYILAHVELEKKDREKGKARDYYTMFVINTETKDVAEFALNLEKRDVQDATIRLDDENGKVLCAGFYSDLKAGKTYGNDIDGFFYMTIDIASLTVEKVGTKKIEKKVILELMNRKKAREGQGLSNNFEILRVIGRSDGSTTIVAEHRYVQVVTSTMTSANGVTTTTTTYHYFNFSTFIIGIDSEGQVQSLITIPKKQHTVNDGGIYNSMLILDKNDRLILIYNDNPENLNENVNTLKETDFMANVRKACLVAVEVFKDGKYTRQKLQDNAKSKTVVMPKFGFEVEEGKYIATAVSVPAACGCLTLMTKFKMGLVTFKMK